MPISFDPTPNTCLARDFYHRAAAEQMRPISRRYDELEHACPQEWVDWWWREGRRGPQGLDWSGPHDGMVRVCMQAEELCWGDAGLYLRTPTAA
mgnify:FL=1